MQGTNTNFAASDRNINLCAGHSSIINGRRAQIVYYRANSNMQHRHERLQMLLLRRVTTEETETFCNHTSLTPSLRLSRPFLCQAARHC
jgi:hypothetical protein